MSRARIAFVACIAAHLLGPLGPARAAGVPGQGTWETTLQARDLDGDLDTAEAYYDTELNITWLADANAITGGGWSTVNAWATSLDPYGSGITGWRLPMNVDVNDDGCTFTNYYEGVDCGYNISAFSEMAHMFYATLGNLAMWDTAGNPQPGGGLTNTGPFSGIVSTEYWSATFYPFSVPTHFAFNFQAPSASGIQWRGADDNDHKGAWAVHAGDVGTPLDAPACANGIDDDGDGVADYPTDPGCASAEDEDEHGGACDNGVDDDGDTNADYPDDVGCQSLASTTESPQCQDGLNNDNALGTDFDGGESVLGLGNGDPNGPDPQCTSAWKNKEAAATGSVGCGVGPELLPGLVLLGLARRRREAR